LMTVQSKDLGLTTDVFFFFWSASGGALPITMFVHLSYKSVIRPLFVLRMLWIYFTHNDEFLLTLNYACVPTLHIHLKHSNIHQQLWSKDFKKVFSKLISKP
jgi:hypothetical protein